MRSVTWLLLSLLACTFVLSSPAITKPDQRIPPATKPIDESLQRRQTSAKEIRDRQRARRVQNVVKRNAGCAAQVRAYPSGRANQEAAMMVKRAYPTCSEAAGSGYARYPNWDNYENDLPGNPYWAEFAVEQSCIDRCEAYPGKFSLEFGGQCYGAVWSNRFCYLKSQNVCSGRFINTSAASQMPGAAVSLYGDCASWAPFVPAEMDAVCCNN